MYSYLIHTILGDEVEDVSEYGARDYADSLNVRGEFVVCVDSRGRATIVRKDQISYVEQMSL